MDKALKAAVVEISMGDWSKRPTTATGFLAQAILQLDQQMMQLESTQVHSEYVKLNREMIQELMERVKALETPPSSPATTAQEATLNGAFISPKTWRLAREAPSGKLLTTTIMAIFPDSSSLAEAGLLVSDLQADGWILLTPMTSDSQPDIGPTLQTPPSSGAAGIKVGDCSCAESVLDGYRRDYGRATWSWRCPVHGTRTLAAHPNEAL